MGKEIEPLSTQQTRDQCPCHPIYLHRSDGTPSHAEDSGNPCDLCGWMLPRSCMWLSLEPLLDVVNREKSSPSPPQAFHPPIWEKTTKKKNECPTLSPAAEFLELLQHQQH
jgi:hypothetical protein